MKTESCEDRYARGFELLRDGRPVQIRAVPVELPADGRFDAGMYLRRCAAFGAEWQATEGWLEERVADRLAALDRQLAEAIARCPLRSISEKTCAPCARRPPGIPQPPCPCAEIWVHSWLFCERVIGG